MTFDLAYLRKANRLRLPQFRDKHGRLNHTKVDGSDWSPETWTNALLGELGEFIDVRLKLHDGALDDATFETDAASELADVQCYLDFVAMRCLDKSGEAHAFGIKLPNYDDFGHHLESRNHTPDRRFQELVRTIGFFANDLKKYRRGDYSDTQWAPLAQYHIFRMQFALELLARCALDRRDVKGAVDLAQATCDKFNEVSRRVGADVRLDSNGAYRLDPA